MTKSKKTGLVILAVAVIVGVMLVREGHADAPDPHVGASTPVREQNLDGNGWVAVHEQGTADVNVTGGSLDVTGTVSVNNFPNEQDVNVTNGTLDVNVTGGTVAMPSVTTQFDQFITIGPDESADISFSTIEATRIHVAAVDDEFELVMSGPLGGALRIRNLDPDTVTYTESHSYPVPISWVNVECKNETNNCGVYVVVTGF